MPDPRDVPSTQRTTTRPVVWGAATTGLIYIVLGSLVMLAGWLYANSIRLAWPTIVVALPSALLIYSGLLKIRSTQNPSSNASKL